MRCQPAALALLIASLASSALAVSIGTGAFTGTQSVEHFEGIGVGANVARRAGAVDRAARERRSARVVGVRRTPATGHANDGVPAARV